METSLQISGYWSCWVFMPFRRCCSCFDDWISDSSDPIAGGTGTVGEGPVDGDGIVGLGIATIGHFGRHSSVMYSGEQIQTPSTCTNLSSSAKPLPHTRMLRMAI